MPIDPQAQALIDQMAALNIPPYHQMTPEEARRMMAGVYRGKPEDVHRIQDRRIPGPGGEIPIRIYTPAGTPPLPLLVFFHGGGWVIGDLESHDVLCRQIANRAECVVVAVDYRLAPEHKFPAAAHDAYTATVWAADHATELGADPGRVAVFGDSAGGNLAAVVALMARDRGGPRLIYQVLAYPVTDYSFETASYRDRAEGYILSRDSMKWFWQHYLPDEAAGADPLASPLRAKDLSGLPPALILTAGYDPLCSEGDAYAERLQEAGVPVEHRRYNDLIHGFLSRPQLDQGQEAVAEVGRALRAAFARST